MFIRGLRLFASLIAVATLTGGGGVTPPRAPAVSQTVTIRYRLLPKPDAVSVKFR